MTIYFVLLNQKICASMIGYDFAGVRSLESKNMQKTCQIVRMLIPCKVRNLVTLGSEPGESGRASVSDADFAYPMYNKPH